MKTTVFHLSRTELDPIDTNHQLFRLSKIIIKGFEDKKYTKIAFLDFAQAFNRVWHTGFLQKPKTLNPPNYLYALLKSFLNKIILSVNINDSDSSNREIKGVPQGSILL